MALADQYGISRLVTLCELYISKTVEKATADKISVADIDVVDLLCSAQLYHANQLADFALHWLSVNYQPMKKRPEFTKLEGENLKYVEEHQWPPVSYLKELEVYEKAMAKHGGADKCSIM